MRLSNRQLVGIAAILFISALAARLPAFRATPVAAQNNPVINFDRSEVWLPLSGPESRAYDAVLTLDRPAPTAATVELRIHYAGNSTPTPDMVIPVTFNVGDTNKTATINLPQAALDAGNFAVVSLYLLNSGFVPGENGAGQVLHLKTGAYAPLVTVDAGQ